MLIKMYDLLTSKEKRFKKEKLDELGLKRVIFIPSDNSVILDTDNKEELRRQISSAHSKKKKIIVQGSSEEINRIAADDKRVSMLLSPERKMGKDSLHVRNSGLNHVLCDLAAKNDVAIGINFSHIRRLNGKDKALRLGKVMQNVMLCRKSGTPMVLASFGKKPVSAYDLRSFAFSIGMATAQAKSSLEKAGEIFLQ